MDDHSEPHHRRISFVSSNRFAPLLHELNVSLLVSTYQAGKLVVIGTCNGQLDISIHNFELAMGVGVSAHEIAVGTRHQIWFLQGTPELAAQVAPTGKFDQCWLARRSHFTGNIHGHELAYCGQELWIVNTLFSSLCTLDDRYHFVPRWQPPFISFHAQPEDRCHLNGMAVENGRPKYVSAMSETDTPQGWRPTKASSGCILDVDSGETITRGLAMPHSPRLVDRQLMVLDSGRGGLVTVEPDSGHRETIAVFPGYTRGFGCYGPFAFVGLSKIRETAVFGGVPIAEHREQLKCGVGAVDLRTGQTIATFQFTEGVEEIFAVEVLPNARCPAFRGPHVAEDGVDPIWVVPPQQPMPAATASETKRRSRDVTIGAGDWRTLMERGLQFHRQGDAVEAVRLFQQATLLKSDSADLWNNLGNALQDVAQQDAALEAYRRAVAVEPNYFQAHQNIGYLLMNYGEADDAIGHYSAAQAVAPSAMNRVLMATALPVVYETHADLAARRQAFTNNVRQLVADSVQIDTTSTLVPTSFFLAYQGGNDRDILRDLANVYRGPQLCEPRARRSRGKKTKVGFLSAYFRDHTIGRLNLGRIQHLSRERFEVSVIAATRSGDDMATRFRQAADNYVTLLRNPQAARQAIAELGLDVLVFADVGMDALTSTLAHCRMAPVQCVTWGHPSTTGSSAMDFFLSSTLAETPHADQHYSEQLVRFTSLGIHYQRPQSPSGDVRSRFGFGEQQSIYVCPQTLFKFHPDFDAVLAGILRADPRGELVLIEGRVPNWTQKLRARFVRTMPDVVSRIRFLPPQPQPNFLVLLQAADVVLDTLHFGGGNTTLEALAVGTPVVTLPAEFLRGRLTLAMLRRMGIDATIATDTADYVAKAVRLTRDIEFAKSVRRAIRETAPVLFDDHAAVAEWEQFLEEQA